MSMRSYLLDILKSAKTDIEQVNQNDPDLPKLLLKLGFIEKMICSGEITTLKEMIVWIVYISEMRLNLEEN